MPGSYFKNAVYLSHQFIKPFIRPADRVVDATSGNGKDTLFLADLVGPEGQVFAFDIQPVAIQTTRRLLKQEAMLDRVRLITDDHAKMEQYVREPVKAAMFNLGYLPGGDHGITTRPESTLKGISRAMSLLMLGGIISVVAYRGHALGRLELEEVRSFFHRVNQQQYEVIQIDFINQVSNPPLLFLVYKKMGDGDER